jgi:hypothetical protein
MRTTIRLEPGLLRRAKRHAAEQGTTFTTLVREALQAYLGRVTAGPQEQRELPVSGRGGLRPGVDLDDTSSLYDRMDGRE